MGARMVAGSELGWKYYQGSSADRTVRAYQRWSGGANHRRFG